MEKNQRSELVGRYPAYRFINIRPGGNNTSLIDGITTDPSIRKQVNDKIMRLYPDIEQVGFINRNPSDPELMMAGGEFCGNATRSTAYLALDGRPGEVNIKVSGVSEPLRAGVTSNGEAFSEMPVYADGNRVEQDTKNPKASTVYMEGITQYVVWDDPKVRGKKPEEIKQYAREILKQKGYDTDFPAAGVMFVEKTLRGIEMRPVVYVRDIGTTFYETACGSGTTAVAMVLAKQDRQSVIDLPIIQPSGMAIWVSVDYDPILNEFGKAQISGSVEELGGGLLVESSKGDYAIERITSMQKLQVAIAEYNLVRAYDVFKDPPYNEQFTDKEVIEIFERYVDKGVLFISRNTDRGVIGFGAVMPLFEEGEISRLARGYGIDQKNAFYLADLGVVDDFRREYMGKQLVLERLRILPEGSTAIMRTSESNTASQNLYTKLGFTQVEGMEQEVTQRRENGEIKADRRIFFSKVIQNNE